MTEHDRDGSHTAQIRTLEDACFGVALAIDKGVDRDGTPDQPDGGENDAFMQIIMQVLNHRMEEYDAEEHVGQLSELWDTIKGKLDLDDGTMEMFAQRGARLGEELRSPPGDAEGDLVPLAETDTGRTIWAVNADGWDDEAFEGDNVTLGMKPDGSVEPVTFGEE